MTKQTSQQDLWQLDSHHATFHAPQLTGNIDLLAPIRGLHGLIYEGKPIDGFVLGVTPGDAQTLAKDELSDVFARGNDLVATYAETDQRPFALQVYWRVTPSNQGAVVLDTILSLQTDLLECFPILSVQSQLPTGEASLLPDEGLAALPLSATKGDTQELPTERADSVLLCDKQGDWSYAERTHPEDRGTSQVQLGGKSIHFTRRLGGRFLEKGVIRRLRVRGVILPQANDLQLANQHLDRLEIEEPPLTA